MVICKNCGTEVDDAAKFCKNCGIDIVREDVSGTKFCSNCGIELQKDTKFCPECGTQIDNMPTVVRNTNKGVVISEKSSGLAAILSFVIVGLGQIYLGLNKKGIILFLTAFVSCFLMIFIIGYLTLFIVWAYSIYDAYNSGEKMRNGIEVSDEIDLKNLF